ncbi:MAG: 16S rRNA (uracil(1498)-N(3))-methyltransferase [Burkholderiaceae bacterium]
MRIRLLQPGLALGPLSLTPDNSHHLIKVLRAQAGDVVTLFDGQGLEAEAVVTDPHSKHCGVMVSTTEAVSRESPTPSRLIQALCLGDKMDWVVEKATELGVAAIQPVQASRSQLRLEGDRAEKRLVHWQRIAAAAAAQSGRNQVPTVHPILRLDAALAQFSATPAPQTGWLLDPFAQQTLTQAPLAGSLTIAIGPEAGWTDDEEQLARAHGFVGIRCGPRILRTETAGAVVLAAVAARSGEF